MLVTKTVFTDLDPDGLRVVYINLDQTDQYIYFTSVCP